MFKQSGNYEMSEERSHLDGIGGRSGRRQNRKEEGHRASNCLERVNTDAKQNNDNEERCCHFTGKEATEGQKKIARKPGNEMMTRKPGNEMDKLN